MASILRSLFSSKSSPPASKTVAEDVYQRTTDPRMHNLFNTKEACLLFEHVLPARHLARISKNRIVSASDDGKVVVWDAETGKKLHTLEGHTSAVTCILTLPGSMSNIVSDNCEILTGSKMELIVWELSSDERFEPSSNPKTVTEHQGSTNCLAHLRYSMVCSGGKDLCLWDAATWKLLSKYDRSQIVQTDASEIHSVLELEGRNFGIITASNHTQPAVFDIRKSTLSQTVSYKLEFCSYLYSFHHLPITYLASVSGTFFATGSEDGTVVLWSMNTLSAVKLFNCADGISWDPNMPGNTSPFSIHYILILCERYLLAAAGNGFKGFDLISYEGSHDPHSSPKPMICHMQAHTSPITHMEFLPESCVLATASQDGSVRLWGPRSCLQSRKDSTSSVDSNTSEAALSSLKLAVELFMGVQVNHGKRRNSKTGNMVVPVLVGEMSLHSGPVEVVKDLGEHGLATCGDDGIVIIWKNSEAENEKRDNQIRKWLKGEVYFDASP